MHFLKKKTRKCIYAVCEVIYWPFQENWCTYFVRPLDERALDIIAGSQFKTHETNGNGVPLFNVLVRTSDPYASHQYKMIVLHFTKVYHLRSQTSILD